MFSPGDSVGKFILIREVGKGSFGTVWLAREGHPHASSEVALKILNDPNASSILKEVLVWAKADKHPNILPIIDADYYSTKYGRQPVIVTPYLEEGSLSDWMGKKSPISVEAALEMTCKILDGLEHLHLRSIIHRDLKPANILVYQDNPLLADFGISRIQSSPADVVTEVIMGTIPYMAPEVFSGVRSQQTDVWSVAIILYQLLAGLAPFPDANAILSTSPLPKLSVSAPRELWTILSAALRKDPKVRHYKSAVELRDELYKLLISGQPHACLNNRRSYAGNVSTVELNKQYESREVAETGTNAPSPRSEGITVGADEVESDEFIAGKDKGEFKKFRARKFSLKTGPSSN